MIIDINDKLNNKKEMDKLKEDYNSGVVVIEGNNFETLFGKTVYPLAMIANRALRRGEHTFRLECGGYVNLTDEEWHGEWYDRLMAPPADYKEPSLDDLKGAPIQAYQMLAKEPETK